MAEIFALEGIRQTYDGRTVLAVDRLSFTGPSITGLAGPNGSGKSTLLRLLGFIERPASGVIRFRGEPASPFEERVRFQVSLLPQTPYLLKRSVFENVAFGLRLRGRGRADVREVVSTALTWVGLDPDRYARRSWTALSGGEAQRVALAARLVLRPAVLLMDEPTASVDAASARLIQEAAMRACREWGTSLVIASHDQPWLYEVSDRVLHLFRGRILEKGADNILFGPWLPRGDGTWEKILPDGQRIRVTPPPFPEAAAVLPSGTLTLSCPGDPDTGICLEGQVSRLTRDPAAGEIIATVIAGGHPFTVRLFPGTVVASGLLPGRPVRLQYRRDAVTWI